MKICVRREDFGEFEWVLPKEQTRIIEDYIKQSPTKIAQNDLQKITIRTIEESVTQYLPLVIYAIRMSIVGDPRPGILLTPGLSNMSQIMQQIIE